MRTRHAGPLLAVVLVVAACGSSGGRSVAPGSAASATASTAAAPVATPVSGTGTDAALAAALVGAAAKAAPTAGGTVVVSDRAPTTGCRQPGEPAAAISLLPGQLHCGAIVDAPPAPLTDAQRAAVTTAFAAAGYRVRFAPAAGAIAPASPGPAVTVDRILAPVGTTAIVSVLARAGTAAPQVVVVRLTASGGRWRTAG